MHSFACRAGGRLHGNRRSRGVPRDKSHRHPHGICHRDRSCRLAHPCLDRVVPRHRGCTHPEWGADVRNLPGDTVSRSFDIAVVKQRDCGDNVMNAMDILGSLMKANMGASAGRLEKTFGNNGFGVPTGGAGATPGGGSSSAIVDVLGKMAGSMLGGGSRTAGPGESSGGFSSGDLLSSLGKMILGGPAGSGVGSAGAGANSVFGGLAAQALVLAKHMMAGEQVAAGSQSLDIDDATAVIAGLRKPANAREEQQVRDVATLTIRAMINAAKADGRIDEKETERLVGKLREDGISDEEQRFVLDEMRKPMDTDAIVRAVPNEQVAAQIYTASLMAINVDTDAEQSYMQELASKLGLNRQVMAYLHQAVGMV